MASLFPSPPATPRLPVSLVTGFLGSGKTTLLNRLLRHPAMARTAVLVNEFGEIPLDQRFIEAGDGEVVVMANGCLCCSVADDLEGIVGRLFGQRDQGVLGFDRLVIETTGLADPAPIMQLLLNSPLIADAIALDAVIATVDAVHGRRQLDEHQEAVKQAALADRLVITKTDLAGQGAAAALDRILAALNPDATRLDLQDEPPPALLFGAGLARGDGSLRDPASWLGRALDDHAAHLHDIAAETLVIDGPLEWRRFSRWLTRIKVRHAEHLLRVKGILHLAGEDAPVAIHGVHHVFHPPVKLPPRADDDARSRLVFITRGLARGAIAADWRDFAASERT
ncbi:MAG TPA: GTP-binding protein [Stellaceae bacterium]|nr:GTP-binding protein [Stellaceae bacterium]